MKLPQRLLLCSVGFAVAAAPVLGQSRGEQDEAALLEQQQEQQQQKQQQQQRRESVQPGRVAESAVGRVGQRQTSADAAPNLRPTGRISNRIENRVQSRIRNRIDRDYDPQANAKSPFATAEDNERAAGR